MAWCRQLASAAVPVLAARTSMGSAGVVRIGVAVVPAAAATAAGIGVLARRGIRNRRAPGVASSCRPQPAVVVCRAGAVYANAFMVFSVYVSARAPLGSF